MPHPARLQGKAAASLPLEAREQDRKATSSTGAAASLLFFAFLRLFFAVFAVGNKFASGRRFQRSPKSFIPGDLFRGANLGNRLFPQPLDPRPRPPEAPHGDLPGHPSAVGKSPHPPPRWTHPNYWKMRLSMVTSECREGRLTAPGAVLYSPEVLPVGILNAQTEGN